MCDLALTKILKISIWSEKSSSPAFAGAEIMQLEIRFW